MFSVIQHLMEKGNVIYGKNSSFKRRANRNKNPISPTTETLVKFLLKLALNKKTTHFSLQRHDFSNINLANLFESVKETGVTEINLSGSKLGNFDLDAVCQAIQSNNKLIKIIFDGCDIDSREYLALKKLDSKVEISMKDTIGREDCDTYLIRRAKYGAPQFKVHLIVDGEYVTLTSTQMENLIEVQTGEPFFFTYQLFRMEQNESDDSTQIISNALQSPENIWLKVNHNGFTAIAAKEYQRGDTIFPFGGELVHTKKIDHTRTLSGKNVESALIKKSDRPGCWTVVANASSPVGFVDFAPANQANTTVDSKEGQRVLSASQTIEAGSQLSSPYGLHETTLKLSKFHDETRSILQSLGIKDSDWKSYEGKKSIELESPEKSMKSPPDKLVSGKRKSEEKVIERKKIKLEDLLNPDGETADPVSIEKGREQEKDTQPSSLAEENATAVLIQFMKARQKNQQATIETVLGRYIRDPRQS